MAGFIDAAVKDIDNRLAELRTEEQKLVAARAALASGAKRGPGRPRADAAPAAAAAAAAPAPARASKGKATRGGTRRRAGRPRGPRGGNTRANQALELVRSKPGITIPQIAETLKIEPNYLYRVMPKLTSDGLVKRVDQGWHPAQLPAASK